MPIFDHFGLFAPYYDRVFQHGDRTWLFKLLQLPTDGAILDIGGGTGRIAQLFRDHAEQVVVADLSFKMLRQAQEKGGLSPLTTFSETLPFPADSFDRIVMIDALHHVCDHRETATELWRVLKPGGRIVIEEPDFRTFGVKLLAVAEKLLGMRSHFLTPHEIKNLFPSGTARIEKNPLDNFNAWVVVEKPKGVYPDKYT